jgi:serine O-acetyltransferase
MSRLRDTLESEIFRGRRRRFFALRLAGILLFGRGGRGCIAWFRLGEWFERMGWRRMARWASATIERRYSCYISLRSRIGVGLKLPHPVGIVIGQGVIIGARCTIYQHVTLGGRRIGDWRAGAYPVVGDDVTIFAGAVVVGEVNIGDRATIGANAAVLESIPGDSVAVGVPACVKRPLLAITKAHA